MGKLSSTEGASCSYCFGGAAQQNAQLHQFAARNVFRGKGMKVPMLEERGEPLRVGEVIGALPKAVPFLAVGEIDPGSELAEPRRVEDVVGRSHCNGLNELDSLQQITYATVTSIAVIEHSNNGSLGARAPGSYHRSLVNRCP